MWFEWDKNLEKCIEFFKKGKIIGPIFLGSFNFNVMTLMEAKFSYSAFALKRHSTLTV